VFGKRSFPKKLASLREQVGQMLIMGFDGTEMSAKLRSTLATLQPGGIILFARNIEHPAQTWQLLRDCEQSLITPPFLCVDMEGGTVDRLKKAIAPAPAAADVFATGDKKLYRKHGRVIGDAVRTLGFNVDFAPVSDIGFEAAKPVLTSRVVSDNPKQVVTYVREFLCGLEDARVLGCGKHFPGLGEANLDTHKELPSIKKSWSDLWHEDLYPYRMLKTKFPFVMVAHAMYPDVVKDKKPATLSKKWMTDILRKKIGYKGLALCDDLEMGGVLAAASIGEAAVETVRAGADIYMACHGEEAVWNCFHAVLSEADRDRKFARLVAERSARILEFKRKSRAMKRRASQPTQRVLEKIQRELWEFGEQVRLEAIGVEDQTLAAI
jgi:beta-N-acetylhexosaminidase